MILIHIRNHAAVLMKLKNMILKYATKVPKKLNVTIAVSVTKFITDLKNLRNTLNLFMKEELITNVKNVT